jgi:hypothetical protein
MYINQSLAFVVLHSTGGLPSWKQHFRKVALPLLVNDAPRLAILGRAVTKFGIVIAVTGPSVALLIGGFGF